MLSTISGFIHISTIKGLSIYGLLSFQSGLVKINSFFALVTATKNSLLSSSLLICFSKSFFSFSSKLLY
jgi:hypothetical protein